MKDKIVFLVLGILIGAVITAGCFLLFSKNKGPEGRMNGEPPDGNFMQRERNEIGRGQNTSNQESQNTL